MTIAVPKEAAAVILLRQSERNEWELYWARRSPKMPFMSGYHAFPGGRVDASDAEIEVLYAETPQQAAFCACVIREAFEETAVLLSPDAERFSHEERLALRLALMRHELTFAEFVRQHKLRLDARSLVPAGRWVTPPYAARRFDTWFFAAEIPGNQTPELWTDELENGTWTTPQAAVRSWIDLQAILAPPTLHAIRSIAQWENTLAARERKWEKLTEIMLSVPQAHGNPIEFIEVRPGIVGFPVKTPTLPPATHTNCYLIGDQELIVVDPASPYEEEQARLDAHLEYLYTHTGARVREIWLTHHHKDHVAGAAHARARWKAPVAAHPLTAELLRGNVEVDRFLNDGDVTELPGNPGWRLRAIFTPGHAPGHLCFLDENSQAIITGDMIVGVGSVLINPPEGNMREYLESLEKLSHLSLIMILGGHGQALTNPQKQIAGYIKHRLEREAQIVEALTSGARTIPDIVKIVYATTPLDLHPLAERSALAHLEKLRDEGKVTEMGNGEWELALCES